MNEQMSDELRAQLDEYRRRLERPSAAQEIYWAEQAARTAVERAALNKARRDIKPNREKIANVVRSWLGGARTAVDEGSNYCSADFPSEMVQRSAEKTFLEISWMAKQKYPLCEIRTYESEDASCAARMIIKKPEQESFMVAELHVAQLQGGMQWTVDLKTGGADYAALWRRGHILHLWWLAD